jgi:hypothetical protein
MCVALETTIAIVVTTAAVSSKHPRPVAFATEVINTATEQALTRAVEILKR